WNNSQNVNLVVTGTETVAPTSGNDSTTAFHVQNAGGGSLFNVDSTNTIISLAGGYSGVNGAWGSNANSMPANMSNGGAVAANGYIFNVAGNEAGSVPSSHVYSAEMNSDGTVGSWTQLAAPTTVASTSA